MIPAFNMDTVRRAQQAMRGYGPQRPPLAAPQPGEDEEETKKKGNPLASAFKTVMMAFV